MILLCYRHFLLSYLGFLSREGEGVLDLLAVHLENMVGQLLVPDLSLSVGFPSGSVIRNLPAMQETWV